MRRKHNKSWYVNVVGCQSVNNDNVQIYELEHKVPPKLQEDFQHIKILLRGNGHNILRQGTRDAMQNYHTPNSSTPLTLQWTSQCKIMLSSQALFKLPQLYLKFQWRSQSSPKCHRCQAKLWETVDKIIHKTIRFYGMVQP